MGTEYLDIRAFTNSVETTIPEYLIKYDLRISNVFDYGVELINRAVSMTISYRYREFDLTISSGNGKVVGLTDFILKKYPNYFYAIKVDPSQAVFRKTSLHFEDAALDFAYSLKTSFDFLDENFPDAFRGILPT